MTLGQAVKAEGCHCAKRLWITEADIAIVIRGKK
jgi:hypothetical protein